SQRNSERLALLSTQFESELKQSQIELLTQNAKIKEEEINTQKMLSYFYVGGILVVLVIVAIMYYSNHRIKKVNEELKSKTEQVGIQASQLSTINKTKDKLLSIISHDIRSPLSSLRGMLNIAQSGSATKEEFAKLTSRISGQLDSVYEDLGNLLQWTHTQLQGLVVKPEPVQLAAITDEVLCLFKETADEKRVELKSEIKNGTEVLVDPNHLRLVLRNLISNAIKFSYKNSQVNVNHSVSGNMVTVSVCDKGTGIDKEQISLLFDATSHVTRQGTANEKGMGVGLLLTKEFVEKNGGAISVRSEVGSGTVFSFTLKKAT
ncbi:MAG: HAMP domain-containing sensor histidine kinase, partial [Cyclobacteriaceae bacterium]